MCCLGVLVGAQKVFLPSEVLSGHGSRLSNGNDHPTVCGARALSLPSSCCSHVQPYATDGAALCSGFVCRTNRSIDRTNSRAVRLRAILASTSNRRRPLTFACLAVSLAEEESKARARAPVSAGRRPQSWPAGSLRRERHGDGRHNFRRARTRAANVARGRGSSSSSLVVGAVELSRTRANTTTLSGGGGIQQPVTPFIRIRSFVH